MGNTQGARRDDGMEKSVRTLRAALSLTAREHIALVGAGGKTTLMFALAEEFRKAGKRVITSTTTKVWHHQAMKAPCVAYTEKVQSWQAKIEEGLARKGHVFAGRCVLESGKVDGIDAALSDRIFKDMGADCQLVEADGAAGLPVKAPAAHEPVIPPSATMVVAVMGLEALNLPLGSETVFRPDEAKRITGLATSMPLTPIALSRLFIHPEGLFKGAPGAAARIAFLNKVDLVDNNEEILELAGIILSEKKAKIRRVVLGSLKLGRYRVLERE